MDKLDLLVELIKETRADVKEIKTDVNVMKVDVELNKDDLKEHMRRTVAVENLAMEVRKEANSRIENIEKKLTVGHLFKLILTGASAVGTIAGTIYGVSRIL